MTTEGDIIYYHSGAAARLPIGSPGQVIGVVSGDPTYTSGAVNAISSGVTGYTLVATDASKTLQAQNSAGTTITVPTNATVAFPINTQIVCVQGASAGPVTIGTASGVTLQGVQAVNSPLGALVLTQIATNVWTGVSTRNDPVNAVSSSGSSQTLLAGYMNRIVLSANCTVALPPPVAGSSFTAAFIQPASGGPYIPTITGANWGTSGTPSWSTVAGKKDIVVGVCDDGATYDCIQTGTGF